MPKKRSKQESKPNDNDGENDDFEERSNLVSGKWKLLVALNKAYVVILYPNFATR